MTESMAPTIKSSHSVRQNYGTEQVASLQKRQTHSYKVSVIICAYTMKRWNDLLAAVKSVQEQTLQPEEIIVVVDHNPDLFLRLIETVTDIVVIENREERGLSGARNSGIAQASGDIFAFMDEDATAHPQWLQYLCASYTDPQVIGVGGQIIPKWQDGRPGWFPPEFDWVVGCTYLGMPLAAGPVRNLIGCNMSFRRSLFAAIGGFRSGIGRIGALPVGCEETEFCIRARQHWPDRLFYYEPRAQVNHAVPDSRARWDYFRSRCYFEGRSKALVTRLLGRQDGLSSERTYTYRTLPQGVMREIRNTVLQWDMNAARRAAAIVTGLAATTAGYLMGHVVEQW